jgi:hypothetical protein
LPEEEQDDEGMRAKFSRIIKRSRRKNVYDSEDEEETPQGNDWDGQLAACARSQPCQEGLVPELNNRIKILDQSMDSVSENLADVNKVIGARNALQSLKERLQGEDEDARQA